MPELWNIGRALLIGFILGTALFIGYEVLHGAYPWIGGRPSLSLAQELTAYLMIAAVSMALASVAAIAHNLFLRR